MLRLEGGNGESNGRGNKNTSKIRDLYKRVHWVEFEQTEKNKVHQLDVRKWMSQQDDRQNNSQQK